MTRVFSTDARVILDTNLAVLLCVGLDGIQNIERHKRLSAFTIGDFELLRDLLRPASEILLSPNIATEVSNLLGRSRGRRPAAGWIAFRQMLSSATQIHVPSKDLLHEAAFDRLGLADTGVLRLLSEHTARHLLTADLDLYWTALKQGSHAINFNHLRN